MSSQWNRMIFFRRFHTIDLSSLMRRNPNSADAVMRTGLSSYLRNVNPEMTEEQISAMADANAVLMESLASAQGRTIADFVEGLTGLGVTDDPSLRGQYREENGTRSIVLNSETMSPTTFSHEVGHYFLMTLPDGPVKDRIVSAFSSEYKADGNKIGIAMNEAFSRGLVEYQVSGVAANPEIRSIFDRLLNAMRRFIDRIFRTGGLTAEQKAVYDSFFNGYNNRHESSTAIRERQTDRGRDDLGSDRRPSRGSERTYAESGMAEGLSGGVRLSEGADNGRHLRRVRLLNTALSKISSNAKYVEINQIPNTDAGKFHNALANVQKTNPKGLYVSLYSVEEYADPSIRLFMSEDESVGFAIKSDGDIVSVFSDNTKAKHPKSAYTIPMQAIENGGTKLDCYGYDLLKVYMRMGFVPQGKVAYNAEYENAEWSARKDILGEPPVFALYYGDSSIDETLNKFEERLNTITDESINEIKDNLPEYTDTEVNGETVYGYDQLMSDRDKSLEGHTIALNEDVDLDSDEARREALKDRIKRGRAAQAQRRRRFYENIDAMLDKNMYVESDDLRRYRSNLERELREAHENDPGFKFTDDARYRRVLEEYHARDMMLL